MTFTLKQTEQFVKFFCLDDSHLGLFYVKLEGENKESYELVFE